MNADDVTRIRVGRSSVGIMGLQAVIEEMAGEYMDRPDEVVREELFNRLCKRNYIPEKLKQEYAAAFLREFKKSLGKPVEEETSQCLEIKVLGPGCVQCDRLEKEIMEVMAETGIVADVEHVRDIKGIGRYGVMGTPALLINGQVKSVGKVPVKSKLIKWLKEAKNESDKKSID